MGRMTQEQEDMARKWGDSRKTPKQIVNDLRINFPGNTTSAKQVSNYLQKLHYKDRGEVTVTQWSLVFLQDEKYICHPLRNMKTNKVEILLFAHQDSLRLFKKYPHVVIIDATYKMNKYDMALVEIVGFTCTHKTFNIAFAFTTGERVSHYKFIMSSLHKLCVDLGIMPKAIMTDCEKSLIKAIKIVFEENVQQLLCWVHIRNNLKAHADKVIKNSYWSEVFVNQCWSLFCSSTKEMYEERLEALRKAWKIGLVKYVEAEWLTPYKKCIIRAWTDYHLHFFTRTSNRVEGMHRVLKDIIGSSRDGFNRVIVRIHHAIIQQVDVIRATLNISLSTQPMIFQDPDFPPLIRKIFSRLLFRVSDRCIDLLLEMCDRIVKGDYAEVCDDHWVKDCLGLPCVHDIARSIITKTPIVPDDINEFWKQLSWEENVPIFALDDDNLAMSILEMRMREFWSKMEAGTLKRGTLHVLSEVYYDLEHPGECSLGEPTEKVRRKGRPAGAKNKSKTDPREKSHHECIREELLHAEKEKAKGKAKEKVKEKVKEKAKGKSSVASCDQSQTQSYGSIPVHSYMHRLNVGPPVLEEEEEEQEESMVYMGVDFGIRSIDYFWYPYISGVKDVRSDGHCGYRSMALLLGMRESQFGQIRAELGVELLSHQEQWEPIRRITREGTWNDLIEEVSYMRSPCGQRYWLDMPFMGLVFATTYNVGLVVLSWDAPSLCLPIRGSQSDTDPPKHIIAITYVGNQNHWIPVWIRPNSPLPSTPGSWRRFCDPSIKWWEDTFKDKLDLFRAYRVRDERPEEYFH